MITLSIRYTLDANKLADWKAYAEAEIAPITESGGSTNPSPKASGENGERFLVAIRTISKMIPIAAPIPIAH